MQVRVCHVGRALRFRHEEGQDVHRQGPHEGHHPGETRVPASGSELRLLKLIQTTTAPNDMTAFYSNIEVNLTG